MVLRTLGVMPLARLLGRDILQLDTAWLLFGPTDSEVVEAEVEDEDPPMLLAAE